MAVEIERKFIVKGESWKNQGYSRPYSQAYIPAKGATVRVRITGDEGYITIKGPRTGISRSEFEYAIPAAEAEELISTLCLSPPITKTRHFIEHAGSDWIVDEFHELNQGLIVAEVELDSEEQNVSLPDWVGEEVSTDLQYSNAYLNLHPFSTWGKS